MQTNFSKDIEECVKVLKAGNLILYPTDTIWGIGCDATNESAVEKIFRLKERSDKKTMIVLVAGQNDVSLYARGLTQSIEKYLQHSVKPITVIYEYARGLAKNLVPEDGTVAIRICKETFCHTLLQQFGKPIVSTSANISGEKPPAIFSEINEKIKKGVDYVVQYRQDDISPSIPSTIIKWENGQAVILRQ